MNLFVLTAAAIILLSARSLNGQGFEGNAFLLLLLFFSFKLSLWNFSNKRNLKCKCIFFFMNRRIVLPIPPKVMWESTRDQVTTLLNKPYSPATYASMSSYIYQIYGEQAVIDVESKQACRLNGNMCRDNSQCCSKFCRCTKWGTLGRETCWRKCL